MASYSFFAPRPTNAILSDVDHIREIQGILAQLNPSLADDAPEDSKRLVPLDSAKTQYRFERLTGSSWNSVGKLMHDVDTLDGYHASISAVQNTIPVYNADAKLVGDLTGNANTATTLKNIRKLQIGGIASGGSVSFDGSADATIEITQLTVNNANDTAINGVLTVKHGGTGGADAATARANLGVPAIDHSSTAKTFGVSSTTKYGHAIGSDTPNSTFTADKGYFFSPKGADDLNSSLRVFIAEELTKKLNLSGGKMTGDLHGSYGNAISDFQALELRPPLDATTGGFIDFHYAGDFGDYTLRLVEYEKGCLDIVSTTNQPIKLNGIPVLTSAGGTIMGHLSFGGIGTIEYSNNSDYRTLWINRNVGNAIGIFAVDDPHRPGQTMLRASDGSRTSELWLFPDGTATLGGHSVITSAGGTVTGSLTLPQFMFMSGLSTSYIFAQLDDVWANGARIELNPGSLGGDLKMLAAKDGVGTSFHVKPGDGAYIDNNKVITSAGGAMWSVLWAPGIAGYNNNGLFLFGGSEWGGGGYCSLGGPNHTYPNYVQLCGGSRQVLQDLGNGWNIEGAPVLTLVSSWNDGNGNWYRRYNDGWLEQGGFVKENTIETPVTFHAPFANTNYWFTSCAYPYAPDASGGDGHKNRTTTGCTILHTAFYHNTADGGAYWYACGY